MIIYSYYFGTSQKMHVLQTKPLVMSQRATNQGAIPGNTHCVAEGCKREGKCAVPFLSSRSREAALHGKSKDLKTDFDAGLLISSQRAHTVVNEWMSGFFDCLRLFTMFQTGLEASALHQRSSVISRCRRFSRLLPRSDL